MDRQRYMAELSKLLAFMFKEDKEEILAQYNKMLDEAEDEQAMLDGFGSPTKLAVTISRTYDRTERKLAVNADSRENSTAAAPVPAAPQKKAERTAETAELSYADIIEEIRREKAEEEGIEYKPIFFNEPVPEPEPEAEAEIEPASEPVGEEAEESADAVSDTEAPAQEPENPEDDVEAEADEEVPAEAETESAETPAEEAEETPDETEDAADEPAETEETEDTAESSDAAEEAVGQETPAEDAEDTDGEAPSGEENAPDVEVPAVRYKTNVPLLILYLIIAVPVGIALVAAAIIIGLALLAVGAGLGAAGVRMIGFAFSSFVIAADVMLCSGVSLIAIAVALIVLLLGILMFAKGIGGIVGAVMALGRKFCVREVPENE